VEDQTRAVERIPNLLATPAAVRWISAEPLLGLVDLTVISHEGIVGINALTGDHGLELPFKGRGPKLDWVVAGGESGPASRPMHPDWPRSLRDQCLHAGVPFFFKQWGEWAPRHSWGERLMTAIDRDGHKVPDNVAPQEVGGQRFARIGETCAGRLLDGIEHNGMPGQP
jgi:protein gp37